MAVLKLISYGYGPGLPGGGWGIGWSTELCRIVQPLFGWQRANAPNRTPPARLWVSETLMSAWASAAGSPVTFVSVMAPPNSLRSVSLQMAMASWTAARVSGATLAPPSIDTVK